jgi:nucleoside-diphosphate-sugar epimerase
MTQVPVTGSTGFIGSWCILTLLDAGHTVRTTARDRRREPALRSRLHAGCPPAGCPGTRRSRRGYGAHMRSPGPVADGCGQAGAADGRGGP